MKIVTIVGARPQFVKAAAVGRAIRDLKSHTPNVREVLIHTGQHYDANMSDVFFHEMGIPKPDYHLGIGGLAQGAMTGRMIETIEAALETEKPNMVLIYGDTNSTLAGALAAVKMHIPVAHVEAGLRSFNRKMPEEINRIVADQCSDILFTPSATSTQQLIKEGIPRSRIHEVGDVMYDAALYYQDQARRESQILSKLNLKSKQYVLSTIHRAENTDCPERLKEIFLGLIDLAKIKPVVLPLHPRTRQTLEKQGLLEQAKSNLTLIDPVGYLDMVNLESNAEVILTDSGGVQKEAYFFKVPCLTLRTETEWVELVEEGFNRLVPLKRQEIVKQYKIALNSAVDWTKTLYGNGQATQLIVQKLLTG